MAQVVKLGCGYFLKPIFPQRTPIFFLSPPFEDMYSVASSILNSGALILHSQLNDSLGREVRVQCRGQIMMNLTFTQRFTLFLVFAMSSFAIQSAKAFAKIGGFPGNAEL